MKVCPRDLNRARGRIGRDSSECLDEEEGHVTLGELVAASTAAMRAATSTALKLTSTLRVTFTTSTMHGSTPRPKLSTLCSAKAFHLFQIDTSTRSWNGPKRPLGVPGAARRPGLA